VELLLCSEALGRIESLTEDLQRINEEKTFRRQMETKPIIRLSSLKAMHIHSGNKNKVPAP
jgi:hypothetical protein